MKFKLEGKGIISVNGNPLMEIKPAPGVSRTKVNEMARTFVVLMNFRDDVLRPIRRWKANNAANTDVPEPKVVTDIPAFLSSARKESVD